MSKVPTELKHIKAGDLVYEEILINKADWVDDKSKSGTSKNIRQGKPVKRICIVLVPGEHSIEVTYLATFDQRVTLPATLDKSMWYPFKPAHKEGNLEPLPELSNNKDAQWACLRTKQTVTKQTVQKLTSSTVPESSVNLVRQHMHA